MMIEKAEGGVSDKTENSNDDDETACEFGASERGE